MEDLFDHEEQHRHEEDGKQCRAHHPADDSGTDGDTGAGTGTGCPGQRHSTDDGRERRHQDRSQTDLDRIDQSRQHGTAVIHSHLGIFDDEDRVLGGQTNQHDHTDLHVDISGQASQILEADAAHHGRRHTEDNAERQRPRFVQGGQAQVHEDQGSSKNHIGGRTSVPFITALVDPFIGIAAWQIGVQHFFDGTDCLARRIATGGCTGDLSPAGVVEPCDDRRCLDFLCLDDSGNRDQVAGCILDKDIGQFLRIRTELRICLHDDLPGSAEEVEVVDFSTAEVGLESRRHVGDRDIEAFRLFAVQFKFNGRCIVGECRVSHGDFRALVDHAQQLAHILVHRSRILADRIHDEQTQRTCTGHARQDGHVEGADRGFRCIRADGCHLVDDFLDLLAALGFTGIDIIQLDREQDTIGLIKLELYAAQVYEDEFADLNDRLGIWKT